MTQMRPEESCFRGWSPANPEIRVSIDNQATYLGDALLADREAGRITQEEFEKALDKLFPKKGSES